MLAVVCDDKWLLVCTVIDWSVCVRRLNEAICCAETLTVEQL